MPSLVPRVLFLGANGHCGARLEPARAVLRDGAEKTGMTAFDLIDAAYPGFEGRPRASGFPEFLDAVAGQISTVAEAGPTFVYGTGIGALIALCLRARDGSPRFPSLAAGARAVG